MPCTVCGGWGHNRLTCPSDGGGGSRGVRKKSKPKMVWCPKDMIPVRAPGGGIAFKTSDELYGAKVTCKCGGTHLPCGTAKGAASWRAHMDTKRHQEYEERQFQLFEERERQQQQRYPLELPPPSQPPPPPQYQQQYQLQYQQPYQPPYQQWYQNNNRPPPQYQPPPPLQPLPYQQFPRYPQHQRYPQNPPFW